MDKKIQKHKKSKHTKREKKVLARQLLVIRACGFISVTYSKSIHRISWRSLHIITKIVRIKKNSLYIHVVISY